MKNVLLMLLLTAMLTGASSLKGAEIIPVWNTTVEGKISDMDFLKGQNEILVLIEGIKGQIQKRNPNNGELISSYPISLSQEISKLSLTPDSARFILINGSGGTLRNLDENYSIVNTFFIQRPKDSIFAYFTLVTIDPIRPIAYVTTSAWDLRTNLSAPYKKVIAYNYETGEHIKDLTGYGEDEYTAIEVSHDGKYLATLNDHKAYLKVWDLATMELVINEPLFDVNITDWCRPEDIYFSKLDDNVIYISGFFNKRISSKDVTPPSIYKFNMQTKSRELILPDEIYGGFKMIFLDNEERIFNSTNGVISVINLEGNKVEYHGDPENVYKTIVRYNSNNNYFLGSHNNKLSKFLFDSQSSINTTAEEEIIISPNPTNGFVNINLNCTEATVDYQISDINGALMQQNTIQNQNNILQFNFTPYPSGVYFLKLICNNHPKTYKIIKEG